MLELIMLAAMLGSSVAMFVSVIATDHYRDTRDKDDHSVAICAGLVSIIVTGVAIWASSIVAPTVVTIALIVAAMMALFAADSVINMNRPHETGEPRSCETQVFLYYVAMIVAVGVLSFA